MLSIASERNGLWVWASVIQPVLEIKMKREEQLATPHENPKRSKRIHRFPCVRKAFCTDASFYFGSISVAFRGHGFRAVRLRLPFSSLQPVFHVYFELRR